MKKWIQTLLDVATIEHVSFWHQGWKQEMESDLVVHNEKQWIPWWEVF